AWPSFVSQRVKLLLRKIALHARVYDNPLAVAKADRQAVILLVVQVGAHRSVHSAVLGPKRFQRGLQILHAANNLRSSLTRARVDELQLKAPHGYLWVRPCLDIAMLVAKKLPRGLATQGCAGQDLRWEYS